MDPYLNSDEYIEVVFFPKEGKENMLCQHRGYFMEAESWEVTDTLLIVNKRGGGCSVVTLADLDGFDVTIKEDKKGVGN